MSAAERQTQYFDNLKAIKKAKEEAEAAAEEAKKARMTDEELAAYEKEKGDKAAHDAKKDKVINRTLAQYGGRGAAILASGSRGRGRGRG